MTVQQLRDFIYENYYRRIRFRKENNYYSMKRQKKEIVLHFFSIICNQINRKNFDLRILMNTINLI